MDEDFHRKDTIITFRCLKTNRICTNCNDVRFTDGYILAGGGYFYDRNQDITAKIIIKRKRR